MSDRMSDPTEVLANMAALYGAARRKGDRAEIDRIGKQINDVLVIWVEQASEGGAA